MSKKKTQILNAFETEISIKKEVKDHRRVASINPAISQILPDIRKKYQY